MVLPGKKKLVLPFVKLKLTTGTAFPAEISTDLLFLAPEGSVTVRVAL
jgi:hypothetical protein